MDDRIITSLTKMAPSDPLRATATETRFKVGLANLTADECEAVAMLFLDLQSKRDHALVSKVPK